MTMRSSGILMPVFSLPGEYGIGDLSGEAYGFIDRLEEAGQKYWQILPLDPMTEENCPYQALSCMGGDPLFISPDELAGAGLLTLNDLRVLGSETGSEGPVDYGSVKPARYKALIKAFRRFRPDSSYEEFCGANKDWLDPYSKYRAEHERDDLAGIMDGLLSESDREIFHKWTQYEFFREWDKLHSYASSKGIKIIGDMPYFVSYDSVDVRSHRELFLLNSEGGMEFVSGAPPDGFTPKGQCWGDPIYDWDKNRETGYDWWIKRFRQKLEMFDKIRIDHMRGFESFFMIPEGSREPMEGHWGKGPGMDLFEALTKELGDMDIIAEDLGFLTDAVRELIRDTGYPGMKVLQFAFDSDESNTYLPFNYDTDHTVVYTGTHDNDTACGWYEKAEDWKKKFFTWYVREKTDIGDKYGAGEVFDEAVSADAMVELAMSTRAETCVIPMQDVLGLGSEARVNVPGTAQGNWRWRMDKDAFTDDVLAKLKEMTEEHGRA